LGRGSRFSWGGVATKQISKKFALSILICLAASAVAAQPETEITNNAGTVLEVIGTPTTTLTVDTLSDESDGDFSVGDLSLREAIQLANLDPDSNSIAFDPALTGGGPVTILLTLGEIEITESVSIVGPGQTQLTLSGSSASRIFMIDDGINNSFIDVAISGLRFIDGNAMNSSTTNPTRGGAVYNEEYLTLTDATFSGNVAQDSGGAIYNVLGDVVVEGVTFSGNTATNEDGGGLYLDLGTHTLSNSTFTGNHAGDQGGGLGINLFHANLSARFENVEFTNNSADDDGGGLSKTGNGELVLRDCEFTGNIAGDDGGGAFVLQGSVTVRRSVFDGNTSTSNSRGGGALYAQSAAVRIEESAITNNAANRNGGAIMELSANVTIANSTISGNSTNGDGGGIATQNGTMTVINSTIFGNTAAQDGGGIGRVSGGTTTIRNTLIVGNNASGDGDEISGAVDADANNLLGHTGRSNAQSFRNFTPGASDITATNNGTQPTALASILNTTLANNGGPTMTHLLVANSPALDAGDGALATDDGTVGGTYLATDQRLFPRFFGTGVDIGAVQINSATTEVALSANALTITDVAGGDSTDDLVLSYAGGAYSLVDRGGLAIRVQGIPGSTGSGTDTVGFPDTGIIGIDFDTKDGDDRIVVSSLEPSLPMGFGVAVSNGWDTIVVENGPIDVGGGDFDINSEVIRIETDVITSGSQSFYGPVQLVGDRILAGSNVLFTSTVDTAEVLAEILVAEFGTGEILRFDTFGLSLGTFATGLSGPRGLARDSVGNIYVVEETSGEVERFAADGTPTGTFASGLSSPFDIAIDSAGDVYVTEPGSGEVERFDSAGTPSGPFLSGKAGVAGIDVVNDLGTDYVGIAYPDNVEVFETDGTPHFAATTTGLLTPRDIRLDAIDSPTVVDFDGRIEVVLGDGSTSNLLSGLNLPEDFAADAQSIHYLTAGGVSGQLLKDSGGGPFAIAMGLNQPDGLLLFTPAGSITASLTVNASDTTTFGGAVGGLAPLDSLTTDAAGTTEIAGGMVVTTADQTFNDELLPSDDTMLAASTVHLNDDTLPASSSVGTLSVEGDVAFGGSATLAVDLDGATPDSQHDQLQVNGFGRTVDVNGATLKAEIAGGYVPLDGDTLVLIDAVDPSTSIVGTFAGLAEGAMVDISGRIFTISYGGGDGNDVVLKLVLSRADLAVTNTASTESVAPGEHLTFTIDLTNNGAGSASGVVVSTSVPAGTALVGVTATSGWSAMTPLVGGSGDVAFSKATVSILEAAIFKIVVEVDGGTAGGTVLTNTVTVGATGSIDQIPGNNSATATSMVDGGPPSVVAVTTAAGPVTDCAELRIPFSRITVEIEDLDSPVLGAEDPANYLLVSAGTDGFFSTASCAAGVTGDDVPVEIASLTLEGADPLAVTATLDLPGSNGLTPGLYRFLVCDTITDSAGTALDGDGDTFPGGDLEVPVFRVDPHNLLANGRFDDCPVSLDPWVEVATPPNAVTILPSGSGDASGSPLSAGANLRLESTDGATLGQCVAVEGGVDYDLAARVRFTSFGGPDAQVALACELLSGVNCDGSSLGFFADIIQVDDLGGAWVELGGSVSSPLGAQSAACMITAQPSLPSVDVSVDDLFFGSFGVIFIDGFESGTTSAWSP
jgi:uncharacterized repeat protein (TIGR01451 family)